MSKAARKPETHDIVVEDVFPHAPSAIWKVLTTGALISRWLKMPMAGFEPVVGNRFTYKTTPAGGWDGTINCEVLEVVENRRFVHSWKGGHESNVGYGAPLHTVVTWTLSRSRPARACASSIPASCCRATRPPSPAWGTVGSRS